MEFAVNKTKTWHVTPQKWTIGFLVTKLRFLGYWLHTSKDGQEDWTKHLRHWSVKANFAYNTMRALATRSVDGLKPLMCVRLLHACCRSMIWYGLEFCGHLPERCKEADSFLFEAARRLFDLPIATPNRALSAEYALQPTSVQH